MSDVTKHLDGLFSSRWFRRFGSYFSLLFFLAVIFVPTLWIFSFAVINWDQVVNLVLMDPSVSRQLLSGLGLSISIAAIVTLVDILLGVIVAWVLVRYEYPGRELVDTLLDLPVTVPTSALGLSIFLFWGTRMGSASLIGLDRGLLSPGPALIMMLHIVFCLPYVVRSLVGVISQINVTHEQAAWTLGSPSFTTFRTVGLPQIMVGLFSGGTLAFTRSVSETGATMIVAGAYETAPVLIARWRMTQQAGAAFMGAILVAIACVLVTTTRLISERWRVPLPRTRPKFERAVSATPVQKARDYLVFLILVGIVLVPTFYITVFAFGTRSSPAFEWSQYWISLAVSFIIACFATVSGLLTGIPLAFTIARWNRGRMKAILDGLVNISVMVPTSALAFSLYLFWGPQGLGFFDFGLWLVVLTHVVLAYPYVVRPIIAAIEVMEPTYEEASRTLGARPFTVFRTITYPVIKPAVLAGVAMAFTRSISETGATMIASYGTMTTVPVFIVQWIKPAIDRYVQTGNLQLLADAAASSAVPCALLLLVSFTLLVAYRLIMKRARPMELKLIAKG